MNRTLGDVFCETVRSLGQVQERVLLRAGGNNQIRHCKDPRRAKIDYDVSVLLSAKRIFSIIVQRAK